MRPAGAGTAVTSGGGAGGGATVGAGARAGAAGGAPPHAESDSSAPRAHHGRGRAERGRMCGSAYASWEHRLGVTSDFPSPVAASTSPARGSTRARQAHENEHYDP